MAYTPENNPYIPGDPYSYDLKWIVDKLKEAISLYQPLNDKFDALSDDFDDTKLNEKIEMFYWVVGFVVIQANGSFLQTCRHHSFDHLFLR